MATPDHDHQSIRETVAATLTDHPVDVGFLFGSRARGEAHDRSDVDVAVAFEETVSSEQGHIDAYLALGADLALALGTDECRRTRPPVGVADTRLRSLPGR